MRRLAIVLALLVASPAVAAELPHPPQSRWNTLQRLTLKPSFKPSTGWIRKAQQLQEAGTCKFAGKEPGLTQIEIPFVLLVSAKGGVQSVKVGETGCPELEAYVGQIVRRFGPAQIARPKGTPPFWRQSRFVAGWRN